MATIRSRLSHASGNKTDIEFQAKTIETIVEAFAYDSTLPGSAVSWGSGAPVRLCLSFVLNDVGVQWEWRQDH